MRIEYKVLRFEHEPAIPDGRGEGILVRLRATALDDSGQVIMSKGHPGKDKDGKDVIIGRYPVEQDIEEVAVLSNIGLAQGESIEVFVKRFVDNHPELKVKLNEKIYHHLAMIGLHQPPAHVPVLGGPVKIEL